MKIFVYECVYACVMWDKGLTYLVCASLIQVGYVVEAHRNKVVFAVHMGLLGTRNSPCKVPPSQKSPSNPSLSECEFITYRHMYMCRKHNRSYMESKWHLSIQTSVLSSNMLTCSLTTSIPSNACRDSCRGIS